MLLVLIVSVTAQNNCLVLSQDTVKFIVEKDKVSTETIVVKNICNITQQVEIKCFGEVCDKMAYLKELTILANTKQWINVSLLTNQEIDVNSSGYLSIDDNKLNITTVSSNSMFNFITNKFTSQIKFPFMGEQRIFPMYIILVGSFVVFSFILSLLLLLVNISYGKSVLLSLGIGLLGIILYIFINIITHYNP